MNCKNKENCSNCGLNRRESATNVDGTVIQEYVDGEHWEDKSEAYSSRCDAKGIMSKIPEDGIERRIYSSFNKVRK